MDIRFAVYNAEWMKDLFRNDGTPRRPGGNDAPEDIERSGLLADVVSAIDPDVLCIVEGPDTLKDQSKTASGQLLAWRDLHGLDADYAAVHGIPSGGQQELCALYKQSVVELVHDPEANAKRHPFQNEFLVTTRDTLVKEQYKHYRPPFEISLREPGGGGAEVARAIVAHTKSKGIFDSVDMARFEQLSARNRKKLFAECASIRERCDQYFDADPNAKVIVCGDINDGFGLDYYELRFARSAVEILLGDVWAPDKILQQVLPRPKLGKFGWSPSSSRYRDKLTGDYVNVLIDHILVSRNVVHANGAVWNPYLDSAPQAARDIKETLKKASDHFPVVVDLTL